MDRSKLCKEFLVCYDKENVTNVPCLVLEPAPVTRRRPGRKRGQKINVKNEPYVKTEVMETFRSTGASYGLRQTIKVG